nr:immunoglobulin light chain junction region [Macaca mulatta]
DYYCSSYAGSNTYIL